VSVPLSAAARAVYRGRLVQGLALAGVRLARLARDAVRLEAELGEDAAETKLAQRRQDLQQSLVDGLQARIDLIDDGGP
jgi:hypothetical protein